MDGGREQDRKRKKIRPRGCTGSAAKLQRIEKCGLRRKVREEVVRSASRSRHGGKACGVNLVIGSVREARADQKDALRGERASQHVTNTRVIMTANRALAALNVVSRHSWSLTKLNANGCIMEL